MKITTYRVRKYTLKISISLILLHLAISFVQAQNLVKNGSFEDKTHCPKKISIKLNKKLAKGVRSVSGSAEYYNNCSKEMGFQNPYGFQEAFDGQAYCGFVMTSDFIKEELESREFIQLKLTKKLEKNRNYEVSFKICLAENSGYASQHIGICFSKNQLTKEDDIKKLAGRVKTQTNFTEFLTDTANWMSVKFIYKARGDEKYVVVGNFQRERASSRMFRFAEKADVLDNMKTAYRARFMDNAEPLYQRRVAYYYLDDVVVKDQFANKNISYLKQEEACANKNDMNATQGLNLVPNADFSSNNDTLLQIWETASKGTPDFYENSTGLYLYSGVNPDNREYIIAPLKQTLNPCKQYYFSFDLLRNIDYRFATDHIQMALVDSAYYQNDRNVFPFSPVYSSADKKVIDSREWMHFCDTVSPSSCAAYIIMGNFINDEHTVIVESEGSENNSPYAHYFIDNIYLTEIGKKLGCDIACAEEKDSLVSEEVREKENLPHADTFSINFESNSAVVNIEGDNLMTSLGNAMAQNKHLKLIIEGHADNSGDSTKNYMLSMRRAQSLKNALITNGFNEDKIIVKAYGDTLPLADNATAEGRKTNRRVKIYFVKE